MSLIKGIMKAEIARRVIHEAMKPQNQEKAKRAFAQLQEKRAAKRPPR